MKSIETVREVFDLRHQVKGRDKRLEEISTSVKGQFTDIRDLSERVLRLELELQHAREQHRQALECVQQEHSKELVHLSEQQASQRENFRLQLENLILRFQRSLPPGEQPNSKSEDEK